MGGRERAREAERGSGERMNGLAATRRARCGWNYDRISRTVHPDCICTYVLEVRYEKKERKRGRSVFISGGLLNVARIRDMSDRSWPPLVTIEDRYPPRTSVRAVTLFCLGAFNQSESYEDFSSSATSSKLLKKLFYLCLNWKLFKFICLNWYV